MKIHALTTGAVSVKQSFLFPSRVHNSAHLSTRQYARIVDAWG